MCHSHSFPPAASDEFLLETGHSVDATSNVLSQILQVLLLYQGPCENTKRACTGTLALSFNAFEGTEVKATRTAL